MSEKKYDVYYGSKLLASNVDLDAAFCLIKGYVDALRIEETCDSETSVKNTHETCFA